MLLACFGPTSRSPWSRGIRPGLGPHEAAAAQCLPSSQTCVGPPSGRVSWHFDPQRQPRRSLVGSAV